MTLLIIAIYLVTVFLCRYLNLLQIKLYHHYPSLYIGWLIPGVNLVILMCLLSVFLDEEEIDKNNKLSFWLQKNKFIKWWSGK